MPIRPFSRSASDTSARRTYELLDEPVGRDYRALVEAARLDCPTGVLSLGVHEMSESGRQVVESLHPHVAAVTGAGEGERVLRFRLNAESTAVLMSAADRLFAWRRPSLPDNLCFLREDGSPWLVTIAAERIGFIEVNQLERVRLARAAPRVASVLADEAARDAILATFERRLEERVDPLVEELLTYARTLPDAGHGGLADALQDWVMSGDDVRVAVALEMIASLRMQELRREVSELRRRVEDDSHLPGAVRGNSALRERWRVRRRRLIDGVLVQLGEEAPPAPR